MFGYLFVAIGAVTAGYGAFQFVRHLTRRSGWRRDTAIVVGNDMVDSPDVEHSFFPVLERRGADGQIHRSTEGWGTNAPHLAPGTPVEVLVDPKDESRFVVRSGASSASCGPLVFVVVGLFLLAAGLGFVFVSALSG